MNKRIYFDSSLWVSFFIPVDDPQNPPKEKVFATQQVLNIIKDKDKLLVSTLVLLELIDSLREIIAENYDADALIGTRTGKDILEKSNLKVNQIIDLMTKLEQKDCIRFVDSIKTVTDQHNEIYNLTHNYFWNIKRKRYDNKRKMFICGYDGAHHLDYYHAFCALESNANELVTFDKGFNQLKSLNDFSTLEVIVIDKPK